LEERSSGGELLQTIASAKRDRTRTGEERSSSSRDGTAVPAAAGSMRTTFCRCEILKAKENRSNLALF
jgi:hypothetical protein